MKKFLALLLIGAMTISTVACGGGGSDAPAAEETQPETTEAAPAEPAAEEEAPAAAEEAAPAGGDAASSITLWTYPIGKWGRRGYGKRSYRRFYGRDGYYCKRRVFGLC